MRARLGILLIISVCSGATGAAASGDEDFTRLEDHMSRQELDATGVSSLSAEEREKLNAWIADHFSKTRNSNQAGDAGVGIAQEQPPSTKQDSGKIVARVVSDFDGWSGDTVFELDNGQVWKQRHKGRYVYTGDDSKVVIEKNFFGFHELHHPASGRSVGVKRLE